MMMLRTAGEEKLVCKYGLEEGLVNCANCPMRMECPVANGQKKERPLLFALL